MSKQDDNKPPKDLSSHKELTRNLIKLTVDEKESKSEKRVSQELIKSKTRDIPSYNRHCRPA